MRRGLLCDVSLLGWFAMENKRGGKGLTHCEEATTERIFRDSFCGLDICRDEGHGDCDAYLMSLVMAPPRPDAFVVLGRFWGINPRSSQRDGCGMGFRFHPDGEARF